jgi:hypothetical protein
MRDRQGNGKGAMAEILALQALGWILADSGRAQRLLDMTGLTPDALRAGAGDPVVLGAVLGFLAAHEPDLIACAQALGERPEAIMAAQEALS